MNQMAMHRNQIIGIAAACMSSRRVNAWHGQRSSKTQQSLYSNHPNYLFKQEKQNDLKNVARHSTHLKSKSISRISKRPCHPGLSSGQGKYQRSYFGT